MSNMSELVYGAVIFLILSYAAYAQAHTINNIIDPLYLSPLIRNGTVDSARNLSKVDPELLLGIQSYSGFITVDELYNSNLFFWYFPHDAVKSVPWIIWLNGGPGISSMFGLFDEIGPVKIENGKVKLRNTTWATDYSLLFIDNPVGAGFSFTQDDCGYATNEEDVSKHLYEFLAQFVELFPQQRLAPLFIAGESYAGKYVPAFALKIHKQNHKRLHVNLKGISLGNPLIHPSGMMQYSVLARELGLLGEDQIDTLKDLESSTLQLIDQGKMVDAANKFNETIEYIKKRTGVSIYNYLEDPSECHSGIEEFLQSPEVRQAIHVGKMSFDLNNQVVYQKMLPDIVNSTLGIIEELLTSYGVMCYHGQLDLFVPYSLGKRVYNKMQWPRRQDFIRAPRRRLRHYPDDRVVAYKKVGGNFMEIMVRGCGHMVPSDEPEIAKFIIDMFIELYK